MKENSENNSSLLECADEGVTRLKEKRRELIYQLGKAINELSRQEAIQFLFVSEYRDSEKDIQHVLEKIEVLEGEIRQQVGPRARNGDDVLEEDDLNVAFEGQEKNEATFNEY